MATQYIGAGTFLANEAITAFRMVTISNTRGVGLSATGTRPDGVAQNDAASGDYVTVKFMTGPGTQKGALVAVRSPSVTPFSPGPAGKLPSAAP